MSTFLSLKGNKARKFKWRTCLYALTFVCIGIYMFTVGSMTSYVAQTSYVEKRMRETSSNLALLESEYLEVLKQISIEEARGRGFELENEPEYLVVEKGNPFAYNKK